MEEREEHIGRGTRIMPGVHIGRYYNNVERYYENENVVHAIDPKQLRTELDTRVMPFVKLQKHMFAVAKGLMHNHYVAEGDFKGAKVLLEQAYPEGLPFKVDPVEMNRLNSLSMSKDIDEWDITNQGIGSTFPEYATIARITAISLPCLRASRE